MSRRLNFFSSIKHQQPQLIPYFLRMCKAQEDEFKSRYGDQDYNELYGIPFREVFLKPTILNTKSVYDKYINALSQDYSINEWGVGIKKGSVGHFYSMKGPLEDVDLINDVMELPFPDFLEEYRWEGVKASIEFYKNQDYITMTGIYGDADIGKRGRHVQVPAFIDIFESSWYLRGLDRMLMDFYINPELATVLLDRMTDYKCKLAEKWAKTGIDVLVYGDDVGTQNSLMMSPSIYREWLKPRLRKAIQSAKAVNSKIIIFYHSDGNIEEIIPDLIEVGVDIINPIQPECMNPITVKQKYGDRVSFWGTIGTQTTMPFGTVEEVRQTCREMIDKVGEKGGLILAPTHLLEPDVPFDNIEAFINEIRSV